MQKIFKQEWLHKWVKPSIAELLWIKYDYETEKFDRKLPHVMKNGNVHPIGNALLLSQKNARVWYNWIKFKKIKYNISNEELQNAKTSNARGKTTKRCINLYKDLKKNGYYDFLLE